MELIGDERLDYLLADEHMRIIQSKTVFAFSLDAVLLARFASIPIQRGNILDLCSVMVSFPCYCLNARKRRLQVLRFKSGCIIWRNVAFNIMSSRTKSHSFMVI